jgi:hypothetical protein
MFCPVSAVCQEGICFSSSALPGLLDPRPAVLCSVTSGQNVHKKQLIGRPLLCQSADEHMGGAFGGWDEGVSTEAADVVANEPHKRTRMDLPSFLIDYIQGVR